MEEQKALITFRITAMLTYKLRGKGFFILAVG
jgi:hypothetical protein